MSSYIDRLPFTAAGPNVALLPVIHIQNDVIANGGLEIDTSGWTAAAAATIARDTTTAHSGSASLKVTYSAGTTDSARYADGARIPAPADLTPFVTAYILGPTGFSSRMIVHCYDAQAAGNYMGNVQATVVLGSTWTTIATSATLPAGTTYYLFEFNKGGASQSTAATIWIDDLSSLHTQA